MQKRGVLYTPLKNINRKDFYVLEWVKESTYFYVEMMFLQLLKNMQQKNEKRKKTKRKKRIFL